MRVWETNMKKAALLSLLVGVDAAIYAALVIGCGPADAAPMQTASSLVVFGYNDLGMHCMNEDFSQICVLPPANTLRAQVIDRSGEEPRIVTSGIQVNYSIPGNTDSASKTNFWQFAPRLFATNLPPNIGLFGFGLSGTMQATNQRDFAAPGIPVTQLNDRLDTDYYQLAKVDVWKQGNLVATTRPVIPVSWEMSCDKCHKAPDGNVAMSILRSHDKLHGTTLQKRVPVLCASCHADAALGTTGAPGMPTLSGAMHTAHAKRMGRLTDEAACYSCHPGPVTQCLRDVHKSKGLTCTSCHSTMKAVGSARRRPWVDEPRCGNCHRVSGHQYEQTGVLYRDSVGHQGVKCITCHGSPHAVGPSVNPRDNVQAIALQGYAGTINKCTVCHRTQPREAFEHKRDD